MTTQTAHPPLHILYVEDNADLRETISMLLEGDERVVVGCGDADEALALMKHTSFDVLVTDVSLPTMSGTDLARHVLARQPDAWVVLSSGYAFQQELVRSLGPNVRSLAKPFELDDMEALMDEIARALRGPAAASPA